MSKGINIAMAIAVVGLMCTSCGNKDPHKKGDAAGIAACECYRLEDADAVNACLDKIEKENQEYLTDTAFTNAMEARLLECISQGVLDIVKPIKEAEETEN